LPPSQTPLDSQAELEAEQSFQDYTVRVYVYGEFQNEDYYFEVLKNGKQVYRQNSWSRFHIGHFHEEYREPIQMGQDITGDGIPNLVISVGATIYVFELGKTFGCVSNGL
jgi:hypothetical protein